MPMIQGWDIKNEHWERFQRSCENALRDLNADPPDNMADAVIASQHPDGIQLLIYSKCNGFYYIDLAPHKEMEEIYSKLRQYSGV